MNKFIDLLFMKIFKNILFLISTYLCLSLSTLFSQNPDSTSIKNFDSIKLRQADSIRNFVKSHKLEYDSVVIFKNLKYKNTVASDSIDNMLDVYLPAKLQRNKNYPLIFFLHGGGWNSGDKSFSLQKIKTILDSGFIFISTNYRLSPNPVQLNNSKRIKFPDHLEDVDESLVYSLSFLDNLNIDISKVILMGHSAGGNLAVSLVTMPRYVKHFNEIMKKVRGVVDLDGIALNIPSFINSINGSYKNWFINAFGNNTDELIAASPIFNFPKKKKIPDILLISQNNSKRIKFYNEFKDSLLKFDNNVIVYIANTFNHNQILMNFCDFSNETSKEYTKLIFSFIKDCLRKNYK